jgi:hypothetical protein
MNTTNAQYRAHLHAAIKTNLQLLEHDALPLLQRESVADTLTTLFELVHTLSPHQLELRP